MHGVDLGRYVDALKVFSRATGVQIIISGTEYHYIGDARDKDWEPKFPGSKQKMFLKRGRL
jgi:predicted metal-dependent phosphotriesterase family hydrolase